MSTALIALMAAPLAYAQDCERLARFEFDGADVAIRSMQHVAATSGRAAGPRGPAGPVPAHCRIDGVVDERIGVDGVTYGIRFALALPDSWNGRFLFQGGGGLNGSVQEPVGGVAAGGESALARGFAVISNDTGHQGGGFDASFMNDQQAALDFFYAANTKLTPIAKAMISEHYGRPIEYAYFTGCSTGGREGMIMSQRNPSFFDGIVSGAPAMRTGHSNLTLAYINSAFSEFAEPGADGDADPASLLSDSDVSLVMDALLAQCDADDGLEDGLIFNTAACGFEPAALACSGDKNASCLSQNQVDGLAKAFTGPVDSSGRQVYPPFPWDTGLDMQGRGLPGILVSGGSSPVQSQRTRGGFDVDSEAAAVRSDVLGRIGDSDMPMLSTFAGNGSKLLFYHGMSDPWFSGHETRRYYESLWPANGGQQAVQQFSRLFLVPDMGHCAGGDDALDQFDLLSAVVDWVENGVAPERVISTGAAAPGVSRPLCPYPAYAHYAGGDAASASSFECRVPE